MLEQLKNRRSCRKFNSEKKVETDKIKEVVDAGLYASNGMGYQNGIIIVITNKDIRDKISELNREIGGFKVGIDPFYGAPVILFVAVKKWKNAVYDGSTMIENMMIEATNQELGSCWIHRAKEELESPEGKEILSSLGINLDEYEGVGHVALGYSAMDNYPPKKIKEGRVYYI